MITDEILSHIAAERRSGKSDTDIKKALIDEWGWAEADIDEGLVKATSLPRLDDDISRKTSTASAVGTFLLLLVPVLGSGWFTFMGLAGCGLGSVHDFFCTYTVPFSPLALIISFVMGSVIAEFSRRGKGILLPVFVYILGIAFLPLSAILLGY